MPRLTRIHTGQGDQGLTRLADGRQLPKTHSRIQALGDVDELNAAIGLVRAFTLDSAITALLEHIQQHLFELGADLAQPGRQGIGPDQAAWLAKQLERLNQELPPLREFVLPGAEPASAHVHLARAICRRAERSLWRVEQANPGAVYLNRLSDLLFVVARVLARASDLHEAQWDRKS